jgi:hypothetical protein
MKNITVVIPTSPIPSHPSTHIINAVLNTIRESIPDVPIIITADGGTSAEHLDFLRGQWPDTEIMLFTKVHQSGMLDWTLRKVKTPLIFYLEHDWAILPDVPWKDLSDIILSEKLNYIKLHAYPRISPYHEHLMERRVIYQNGHFSDRYQDNVPGEAIPFILTRQWSQNPHLASTEFYRRKILPMCEGKCDFIENLVHGTVGSSLWEEFRCAIYNPAGGDMMKCAHLDGKNSL